MHSGETESGAVQSKEVQAWCATTNTNHKKRGIFLPSSPLTTHRSLTQPPPFSFPPFPTPPSPPPPPTTTASPGAPAAEPIPAAAASSSHPYRPPSPPPSPPSPPAPAAASRRHSPPLLYDLRRPRPLPLPPRRRSRLPPAVASPAISSPLPCAAAAASKDALRVHGAGPATPRHGARQRLWLGRLLPLLLLFLSAGFGGDGDGDGVQPSESWEPSGPRSGGNNCETFRSVEVSCTVAAVAARCEGGGVLRTPLHLAPFAKYGNDKGSIGEILHRCFFASTIQKNTTCSGLQKWCYARRLQHTRLPPTAVLMELRGGSKFESGLPTEHGLRRYSLDNFDFMLANFSAVAVLQTCAAERQRNRLLCVYIVVDPSSLVCTHVLSRTAAAIVRTCRR